MSVSLSVNGVAFDYPQDGDPEGWGADATGWAQAVTSGMLQKAGGVFTLTADVDFGGSFGLKSLYYKTSTANIASAGQFRLARADVVSWRNQANSANLDLGVNASDQLTFGGTKVLLSGAIVNADIDAAAAIDRSKLASGTADHVLINNGSGVMSSEATLAKVRGGAGADMSSVTFPSSGTIATLTGTQAFTNKDYDGGTASNSSRVTLPKDTTANLAGLTRKAGTLVYDTSLSVVKFDDGATLNTLSSSSLSNSADDLQNLSLSASVGGSALTVALKDKAGSDCSGSSTAKIGFRNSTASTGTYNVRTVSAALSMTVSSGSTLGHRSSIDEYIFVYALDNSGTVELAVSSRYFDDGSIVSTTAEGGAGAADSRTTIYSTTARANVPIRLIGRLKSNQGTAGTWASAISEISIGKHWVLTSLFTPWIAYTPTVSASTSNPTIQAGVTTAYWRRVFDSMEIAYYYGQTSSAGLASGTGVYFWSIPTGFTIYTTVTPTPLTVASDAKQFNSVVGSAGAYSGIRSTSATGVVKIYNSTNLCLHLHEGGTSHQAFGSTDYGFGGSNTIQYSFRAMIPITEFVL